jgi:hypothetical protein
MQFDADKIKSNKKLAKLARKYYRKDMRNEAAELGKMLGNAMKPKPRFVPWFVWMALVKLVIKTK